MGDYFGNGSYSGRYLYYIHVVSRHTSNVEIHSQDSFDPLHVQQLLRES